MEKGGRNFFGSYRFRPLTFFLSFPNVVAVAWYGGTNFQRDKRISQLPHRYVWSPSADCTKEKYENVKVCSAVGPASECVTEILLHSYRGVKGLSKRFIFTFFWIKKGLY